MVNDVRLRTGSVVAFAVAGVSLASAAFAADAASPADSVLTHGVIYTVNSANQVHQTIAIRAGVIVYVGTDRGARAFIGKRTEVIDLHGRMVLPGLIDTHSHTVEGGSRLLNCDLNYAPLTVKRFQDQIRGCLDKDGATDPNGYLRVQGWYRQAMQPSGTQVTKADLDALQTGRPIIVQSTDGHTALANSAAIARANVTSATPQPRAGRIDRDASGQPTGIFEDTAGEIISAPIPPLSTDETLEAARSALHALRKDGETAFMAQRASKEQIEAWSALQKQGSLTARAYMAPDIDSSGIADPKLAVRRILELQQAFDTGPMGPQPNLWVRNSGEIFQDGVLQWPAQTASLLKPYFVNEGTDAKPNWKPGTSRGPDPYIPLEQLKPLLLALADAGIEPEVHAIGDRAVRHTLDAYAYVRTELHGRDVRLQIAHAELVDPADIPRFKELNVIPDMGFQWAKPAPDSIDAAQNYLGPIRFNRVEPEGFLDQAGIPIAQGSDWPVDALSNWFALKVLVTRSGDQGGKYAGRLGTGPGVPLKAAIRAFTINGAYALHSERFIGSLEPGKFADLIVIDQNLLKIPTARIAATKVLLTMVGGKIVFGNPAL